MKPGDTCRHCEYEEKRFLGEKFKICAYCMQPVNFEKGENELSLKGKNDINGKTVFKDEPISLRENTSFLTTAGVMFLAIFGLQMSSFNAFIFGLISAVLVIGPIKPSLIILKFFGVLAILLVLSGKLVEVVFYMTDKVIRYFELWEFYEIKDGITTAGFSLLWLPGFNYKKILKGL